MKKQLAAIALIAGTCAAWGQEANTGYFNDQYTYSFRLNPAMAPDRNFVAMPALGNLGIGMEGNLHVRDVLYNVDGKTTTFLNPEVSASEVMGNLSDKNKIQALVDLNILGAGFRAWGGYNTVNLSVHAQAGISVPKAVFSLLKEGVANKTYDISDMRVRAQAYGELALGHSRNINKQWRVGGALKVLLGGGAVDALLDQATLRLEEDTWRVTTEANMRANLGNSRYKTKLNKHTVQPYVSGVDIDYSFPTGFGLALDLGGVFKLNDDWRFSAALLDLGFISWSKTALATTGGPKEFVLDDYTFSPDENAPNYFDNEWDAMRDDLEALYQLEDRGDAGARTTAMAATLNLGAEYTFPLYRKLTFGLLNSTRMAGTFTTTDFRLSANVAPCRIFSASVAMNAGTYGVGFGWLANLHVPGFNLFLGMDRIPGKLAKQGVPLNSNASFTLGMNFPF